MGLPLTVTYALEPEDVSEGVRVLFAPGPLLRRLRPALLAAALALWIVAGGLLAYLVWYWWRSVCPRWPAGHGRAITLGAGAVWAGLGGLLASVRRDPDWLMKKLCARIARRLLARGAPGPRTLTLSAEGLSVRTPGGEHALPWSAIRRARRDERRLVLAARRLWVFIPLRALPAPEREDLLREVAVRVEIVAVGGEWGAVPA